jgi:hypothetical protein
MTGRDLSASKQCPYAVFRSTNQRLTVEHDHWSLQQLGILHQNVDHGLRIVDVIVGGKAELVENRILADEIGHRIFEHADNTGEGSAIRFCFLVLNNIELDVELFGNPNSIR